MKTAENRQLEALRSEIRSVRNAIVELVVQMDDIRLQQLPQIRANYALKIGCWEQALLEAELEGRRARRRLALAQAQVNRGEALQLDAIEATLDDELAEWMSKAERARLAYERALGYLSVMKPMGRASQRELGRLYRTLVKRLHPDVRHGAEDQTEGLFKIAQVAYHNGDVEALRSLEVATRHLDPKNDDLATVRDLEALEQELELARIEEGVMSERLHKLEECEEMRLGRLLGNPEWVTARTTELRQAIEEWERVRDECESRLRVLREEADE